jgi:hypothetical protein
MKGELNRTVMICVDCYDDRVPRGHFQLASKPQIYSFYGLSHLLIQMDACLDQEKFPQAFTELRKFQRPQEGLPEPQETVMCTKGKAATFSVRVLFRQNASWQGTVTWLEGNQEECFRSVLELIVLMDNALGYSGDNA